MSWTSRRWLSAACSVALLGASQLTPVAAWADDEPLQNVTYRARIDGLARGARILYLGPDSQLQTADPTMVPGRVFEVNVALPRSQQAKMDVSIDLPYSANLHCEILVDGLLVAQADDFIAPRLTRPANDPDYGVLSCQAPAAPAPAPPPGAQPETPPPVEGVSDEAPPT